MDDARETVTAMEVCGILAGYTTPEDEAEQRIAALEAKIAAALDALKLEGATGWGRVRAAGLILSGS